MDRNEATRLLTGSLEGIEIWNQRRERGESIPTLARAQFSGAKLARAYLQGVNLRWADLSAAHLRRADLRDANLRDADLQQADLTRANLEGAKLGGANLAGADLSDANLAEADLRDADLSAACLRRARLGGARLRDADLRHADLCRSDLSGVHACGADFSCADLRDCDLGSARLRRANLEAADLRNVRLRDAKLARCNLSGADLSGADLGHSELRRAVLNGTDLTEADLSDADLSRADLTGAVLSSANLTRAKLLGARCGWTTLTNVDLSRIRSLAAVQHFGPSSIGTDTLVRSAGRVPAEFLRGSGLSPWEILQAKLYDASLAPEEISLLQAEVLKLRTRNPLCIGGVFLSYAHTDGRFADKLAQRLTLDGVNVWHDSHLLETPCFRSNPFAVRLHDIIVIVLSQCSVSTEWLANEVETVRKIELKGQRPVLFPIALDGGWSAAGNAAMSRRAFARGLKKSRVMDFSDWETGQFENRFQHFLRGVQETQRPPAVTLL